MFSDIGDTKRGQLCEGFTKASAQKEGVDSPQDDAIVWCSGSFEHNLFQYLYVFFFFLPTVPHGNQRCGYVESRVYATATIAAQAAWLGVTGRDVKGIWSKKDIKCQYEKSLQFLSVTSPVFFSNTRLSS